MLVAAALVFTSPLAVLARMRFNPSTFSSRAENEWFEVSWSGIPTPKEGDSNDLVLLYASSQVPLDLNSSVPVSYVYPYLLDKASWENGRGSYKFYVPNYKSDIQAVYLRGGSWVPISKNTESAPVQGVVIDQATLPMAVNNRPVGRVLAYTTDPTAIRVTWTSQKSEKPVVYYGTRKWNLDKMVMAKIDTFIASDMCTPPATTVGYLSPGTFNTAVMTNLDPNTRYYYKVGDSRYGFSGVQSFLTAPKSSSEDETLNMIVIADNGAYQPDKASFFAGGYGLDLYSQLPLARPGLELAIERSIEAVSEVPSGNGAKVAIDGINELLRSNKPYHGIIINGDLSYAFGFLSRWTLWLNNYKSIFTSVPSITTVGNHEADDPQLPYDAFEGLSFDSKGECSIPYYHYMRPAQMEADRMWYSTDLGAAHLVQLSTEQEITPGSPQYEFLAQDLKGVDRSKTPWLIVNWHRPMYLDQPNFTNVTGDSIIAEKLQSIVEPLLVEYQADVVFSGHVHQYTRSCPVIKGTCVGYNEDGTSRAPIHIMTGNAGAPGYYFGYNDLPVWMEYQTLDYGFGELQISRTNLTFNMYTSPYPKEYQKSDTLSLFKPLGWLPDASKSRDLYQSTRATPPPNIDKSLFDLRGLALLLQYIPSLVENNVELAIACFGPNTELFAYANSPYIPEYRPPQNWVLQATMLHFINSTWSPPESMQPVQLASIRYTMNYVLSQYLNSGRFTLGKLPSACI